MRANRACWGSVGEVPGHCQSQAQSSTGQSVAASACLGHSSACHQPGVVTKTLDGAHAMGHCLHFDFTSIYLPSICLSVCLFSTFHFHLPTFLLSAYYLSVYFLPIYLLSIIYLPITYLSVFYPPTYYLSFCLSIIYLPTHLLPIYRLSDFLIYHSIYLPTYLLSVYLSYIHHHPFSVLGMEHRLCGLGVHAH